MGKRVIAVLLMVSVLMLFGVYNIPIYATETGNEVSSGENTEEESGFDENAHGEIVDTGLCGENAYDAEYKLYEDGTLYIYGNRREIASCDLKEFSSVYIENGVTKIGNGAFYDCLNLKSITIPNSVKSIGSQVFSGCNSLKKIEIPYGVESIGSMVFYKCSNLESVTIDNGVKEIGFSAFEECSNLKEINLPNSISKLELYLFENCTSLNNINIPNGVTTIESYVFDGCSNLKNVNIPNSVKEISHFAFQGCMKLENLEISKNVKTIGTNAFRGCIALTISCESGSIAEQYAKENDIPIDIIHTHIYESTITKEPTCTESGIRTYTCSCGDEYTEEITATGHDEVIDHAVEPTETKEGKTEGIHCRVCGEVLKAQEIIPATGKPTEPDNPTIPDVEIKNTFNGCKGSPIKLTISCNQSDNFTFECEDEFDSKYIGISYVISGSYVGYKKDYELIFNKPGKYIVTIYKNGNLMEYEKIIVAEEHIWDSGKVIQEANCIKNGVIKYTCLNCKNEKQEITQNKKDRHQHLKWEITMLADHIYNGERVLICEDCRSVLQKEVVPKLKAKVKISRKKIKLRIGQAYTLGIKKQEIDDDLVKWTSSNKKVATVGKRTGKIKAKKKGKAKINLKMRSGCKATCIVEVK